MNINEIIESLGESEKKIIKLVNKETSVKELVELSGLKEIVVMRSLQWLSNKKLVTLKKVEQDFIKLGVNGKKYVETGLPEFLFLKSLNEMGSVSKKDLSNIISAQEINACTGLLKKQDLISIEKKDDLFFSITPSGKTLLKSGFSNQEFLKTLPRTEESCSNDEKVMLKDFLKRKNIVFKDKKVEWFASVTSLGECVASSNSLNIDYHEKVTSKLIKSDKNVLFKKYDVSAKVPSISIGRKHLASEAKKYIKSIWLELGFEEMSGNQVQSGFWNLDALFVPQDHPAREMQDTFYIDGSKSVDDKLFEKVKKVHLNGGNTGSKGWGGSFSRDVSESLMLRTHTTVLSALKFVDLKREDLPKKFFVVDKNFRNEALDWKHLFEFHQVEGIVVDPEGNLPKLKGYLKEFFAKMGFSDVRIRPAHFPYTEPSAEVEAFNPVKGEWVEMGGAGIIRPEVSKTLIGFECPVLAWGLGMERIISKYYEITDIRDIYKNDLEYLKKVKVFIK